MTQVGREARLWLGPIEICYFNSEDPAGSRGLDFSFSITRHSRPEPQTSSATIYNLSRETRDLISQRILEARETAYRTAQQMKTSFITIAAGRPGLMAELCRDALYDRPSHKRSGGDWITTLTAADTRLPWSHGWISESYSSATDPIEIATRQAKLMGIPPDATGGKLKNYAPDLPNFRGFAGGQSLFGSYIDQNQSILSALNAQVRFSRGRLTFFRADTADITPAIELQEGTTLLEFSPPEAFGFRTVRTYLDGALEVGRQIFLRFADNRREGPFRVDEITYQGSTFALEWYASMRLRPSNL